MTVRVALIMAGGSGTRLWPASHAARPKPLIEHLPHPDATLLGSTVARLGPLVANEHIFVVTTNDHYDAVARALPDVPAANLIREPQPRNTAPCIAFACAHIRARLLDDPATPPLSAEELEIVVLPADHFVDNVEAFRKCVVAAGIHARKHQLIATLGITPTYPETGYGYIEQGEAVAAIDGDAQVKVARVRRFVEKPDETRAIAYLAAGNYLWNAGIFIMSLAAIEHAFASCCPDLWRAFDPVRAAFKAATPLEPAAISAYSQVESEAIDTAVMEKLGELLVVPADVGWSDIGSWRSVAELLSKDLRGNASFSGKSGQNIVLDCDGCTIWNEDAVVAAVGLQGLTIISCNGSFLVCPQERAQDVRQIAEILGSTPHKP